MKAMVCSWVRQVIPVKEPDRQTLSAHITATQGNTNAALLDEQDVQGLHEDLPQPAILPVLYIIACNTSLSPLSPTDMLN